MHANVGDEIVGDARHTGDRARQGEIVAILGAGEAVFPGSDTRVDYPEASRN
jgi:hypothetical protein